MIRFHLIAGTVGLTLSLLSGCHCIEQVYTPTACTDSWDPVLGSCNQCGLCQGEFHGHTPVSYAKHHLTCSSGCGEIYWGDGINHPPAHRDPCDNCGNWTGPQPPLCGGTCWDRIVEGWCYFWGYRSIPCGGCGKGCSKGCATCAPPIVGKGIPGVDGEVILDPAAEMPQAGSPSPMPPQPIVDEQVSNPAPQRPLRNRPPFRIRSARLAR